MDVYEFEILLPLQSNDTSINAYVGHHYSCMVKCYDNQLYSSAYSHLHLLYMSYVYVQLLRIAKEMQQEFDFCWIGFPNQEKDFLKNPTSPFSFALINEKPVFRFFRLVGFDSQLLGEISKPVMTRNDRLHAKGDLFCDTENEFLDELSVYSGLIIKIDENQNTFLSKIYDEVVNDFSVDYEISIDDIELSLLGQLSLSMHQIRALAENRRDSLSTYIKVNY